MSMGQKNGTDKLVFADKGISGKSLLEGMERSMAKNSVKDEEIKPNFGFGKAHEIENDLDQRSGFEAILNTDSNQISKDEIQVGNKNFM